MAAELGIGDRVVLRGLRKAEHFNGAHGAIGALPPPADAGAEARYGVLLDLQCVTVMARAANLVPERPLPPAAAAANRAGVTGGVLEESYGRPFSMILDVCRYLVAFSLHDDPDIRRFPDDIERLKDNDPHMVKTNHLMATCWTHWLDPGSYRGTHGRGIYDALCEFVPQMLGPDAAAEGLEPAARVVLRSLREHAGARGWRSRVHGDFWIVGSDGGGTFLVPKASPRAVYQAVGMTSDLHQNVSSGYGDRPSLWRATLVPWYGRLVYDGVVSPVTSQGIAGPPRFASDELTLRLRTAVKDAKKGGYVVERLIEMELADMLPASEETAGEEHEDESKTELEEEQSPPSPDEIYPIQQIAAIATLADNEDGSPVSWTFRRLGYLEEDNPDHNGLVLAGESIVGQFHCENSLTPSPMDILMPLMMYATELGGRPTVIFVDEKECAMRVKHLLRDVAGMREVLYYAPPSKEEEAAIDLGNSLGWKGPY